MKFGVLALPVITLLLTSCKPEQEKVWVLNGKTMGTVWRVSVAGVDEQRKIELKRKIEQRLDFDDRQLSTWKKDSDLSHFNQYTGSEPWPVSQDMADMITLAFRIGQATDGAMDITIGTLVNLWGFGPSAAPKHIPTRTQINQARELTGLQHLQVINTATQALLKKDVPKLQVDLSTMGEGYATDNLAKLMEQEGIHNYLVSVGGAVLARGLNGQQHWRVAIQTPTDIENRVQEIVDLQGQGISTSGDYRNYYELDGKRISHIIDPTTGRPISHKLASVTVIAPTALEADGWDTGLMVVGTDKAKQIALKHKLAVYLIIREGDHFVTWLSPNMRGFIYKKET